MKRSPAGGYVLFMLAVLPLFVAIMFLAVVQNPAQAFSTTGCEGDCTKCHSINHQEVKDLLQRLKIPQAEIKNIQISPIKGLWEISISNKGTPGLFYVDFSKQYIVSGSILEIKTGANKTSEQLVKMQPVRKVDFSKIPLESALTLGSRKAPLRLAVFTDPDCPYCGKLHEEMEKLVQERKDVTISIFMFPLMMHKDAYWKSKSIVCNKSLKMLADAYAHREIPKTECNTKEIDENIKLGQGLGITGTPAIIFPDGRLMTGFLTAKQLNDFLQDRHSAAAK